MYAITTKETISAFHCRKGSKVDNKETGVGSSTCSYATHIIVYIYIYTYTHYLSNYIKQVSVCAYVDIELYPFIDLFACMWTTRGT